MALVIVGTDRDSGEVVEVGLFESIDDPRWNAHEKQPQRLYSVWPIEMGAVAKLRHGLNQKADGRRGGAADRGGHPEE